MSNQQKYKKLLNKHVFILSGTRGTSHAVAEACLEAGANATILGSAQTSVDRAIAKLKHLNDEQRAGLFNQMAAMASVGKTGKTGLPEDVAEAYLWLLKDSNATGVAAKTSGGVLLL